MDHSFGFNCQVLPHQCTWFLAFVQWDEIHSVVGRQVFAISFGRGTRHDFGKLDICQIVVCHEFIKLRGQIFELQHVIHPFLFVVVEHIIILGNPMPSMAAI